VLALAIFLGLASAGPGTFGFVMLDDPSQSLGSGHKQRLAELLAELARSRQVIVATMDQEFRDALLKQATAVEYRFEPWTVYGVNVSSARGGR
jgi:DNA repair exonuclease SbcCD ATPase subunit